MTAALKLVHKRNTGGRVDYINPYSLNEPRTGVLFTDFITEIVAHKARRRSVGYAKGYHTLIGHLNDFMTINDADIFTNSVNERFLDDFILFLREKHLRENYIAYLLQLAKGMAAKAGSQGYAVDKSYQDVEVKIEAPFSVYLSIMEIARIYYFRGLSQRQERIKDLFIVGCLTGLRYSDYSTLTRANFQGDFIVKVTRKTRKQVTC